MVFGRIIKAFTADSPPGSAKYALETSFSIRKGVAHLRSHKWRKLDIQYVLLFPLLLFCLLICEKPGPLARLAIGLALIYSWLVPVLSQFWLNFMPTGVWLILFYSCRYIPPAWRPSIFVRVLPGLETILYGGNLSEVLASSPNSFMDVLAWIPYGLAHYGAPFVVSLLCFLFGPPYFLRVFMFAFGYMNIVGVLIQILFPNAPPWYQSAYGLQKANYGMSGSAGGLARIDKLIGINLYSDSFGASPQVFGAFPSLHSGSAVMEALFLSYLFPKMAPVFIVYVMWIWWSTMYLTHHYFVDLIGGAVLSLFVYYMCALTILPQVVPGKFGRWSYDHVEFGLRPRPVRAPHHRQTLDEEFAVGYEQSNFNSEDDVHGSHDGHTHEMSFLPPRVSDVTITRVGTPDRPDRDERVSRIGTPRGATPLSR